jgi:hypothetical protein
MRGAVDRRHVVAGAGSALALHVANPGAMTTSGDRSRDRLDDVEAALATLARRWETTPPADLVGRLRGMEREAIVTSRGRMTHALRQQWRRTHGRVLVASAVAHSDCGLTSKAVVAARMAVVIARHVGDATTAAHAGVVLAELAAYTFDDADDGLELAAAARAAAPTSYAAVLAMTTEANIRAGRGEPTSDVTALVRAADAVARTLAPGPLGYSLDTIHPGYLPTFAGSALVGAGAIDEGRARLDEAAELFGSGRAPGALSAVRLYQASAALHRRDADQGQALTTQALATSAVRPARWLTDGIGALAERARQLGADWSGLVAQANDWSPG